MILEGGVLHFVECKSGISYSKSDIKAFDILKKNTKYQVGASAIVCASNDIYSIDKDVYCLPLGSI